MSKKSQDSRSDGPSLRETLPPGAGSTGKRPRPEDIAACVKDVRKVSTESSSSRKEDHDKESMTGKGNEAAEKHRSFYWVFADYVGI